MPVLRRLHVRCRSFRDLFGLLLLLLLLLLCCDEGPR
jgi:hypothetical protein